MHPTAVGCAGTDRCCVRREQPFFNDMRAARKRSHALGLTQSYVLGCLLTFEAQALTQLQSHSKPWYCYVCCCPPLAACVSPTLPVQASSTEVGDAVLRWWTRWSVQQRSPECERHVTLSSARDADEQAEALRPLSPVKTTYSRFAMPRASAEASQRRLGSSTAVWACYAFESSSTGTFARCTTATRGAFDIDKFAS